MRLVLWLRARLTGLLTRRDVSVTWLREQERADWRNGFEGVSWTWPIQPHDDQE